MTARRGHARGLKPGSSAGGRNLFDDNLPVVEALTREGAAHVARTALRLTAAQQEGGSDVRANTTRAVTLNDGGPGAEYELTGHKRFCSARRLVEGPALALRGPLLVRDAPAAVADAFCASRRAGDRGLQYGTLPPAWTPPRSSRRHTPPAGRAALAVARSV